MEAALQQIQDLGYQTMIQKTPYDKVVFNGFLLDRLDMDYSFEAGVIPALIAGKYPVLIFRREADMRAKIDSLLSDIGRKDQEVRADLVLSHS